MANDLTRAGRLTIDTAATIAATGTQFTPGLMIYAAPAAAVGAVTLQDGAGNLITTLRAPTSGSVTVDFGGIGFNGFIVSAITASSLLTILQR